MATRSTKPAAPAASKSTAVAKAPAKKGGAVATTSAADIRKKLQEELAKQQAKTQEYAGSSLRVTQDKKFVAADGTESDEVEVIVLDFVSANFYYDRPYNKDNPIPPACFAIHPIPAELAPSDKSPVKQCDTCSDCPQNEWDSSPTGSGKACKNQRHLAVIRPDDLDKGEDGIMLLNVAPTSIKGFDVMVNKLAKESVLPFMVTVNISTDPDTSYAKLVFEVTDTLNDQDMATAYSLRDAAMDKLMTEPDVSGYEPPKAKASPRGKR